MLLAAALAGAYWMPEPVRERTTFRLTPQRPQVPAGIRHSFLLAGLSFTRAMTQGPDPVVVSTTSGVGLASLLLGAPSSGSVNLAAGTSLQNFYIAGYFQDDIRVSKTLTLNLGIRYEPKLPIRSATTN